MLPLETLIQEWQDKLVAVQESTPRLAAFPDANQLIKVAIGMRRAGKTFLLYQVMQHLLNQGIPKEAILYINFEDDRLLPMNQQGMAALLDSFYTLYPENHHRECYLFLDELHNIEGWEQIVRRFFDSKKVQLYLTGSSAKLLSKEIATSLRGRSLAIEVWPYSFSEYLKAHHIQQPALSKSKAGLDHLNKNFLDFLNRGGFPGVQFLPAYAHREVLQQYLELVILRDVIERYGITNISLIKYFAITLLKNFSSLFSVTKFFNDVKSQGYQLAKDTVFNYLNYLEDAYLIATVPLYTESLRRASTAAKKIYAVDTGLIQAVTDNQTLNLGKLLENLVYLDLRRERRKIYYYVTKSGYEIDFVTEDLAGKKELIQVTWDMADAHTKAREERALAEAMQELNLPGRIINRQNYLESITIN
jgi:predicted AAA+ superfamily ATPase